MSAIYFITSEEAVFNKCRNDFSATPGLSVIPICSLKEARGRGNIVFVKGSLDVILDTICHASEISGKQIWCIGVILPEGSKTKIPLVMNGITIKFYENISNFRKTYEDLLEMKNCLCPNGHGSW